MLGRFHIVLPGIAPGWFFLEKLLLLSDRRAMVFASSNNEDERIAAAAERICPSVAEFDRDRGGEHKPSIRQGRETPTSMETAGQAEETPAQRPGRKLFGLTV